MTPGEAAALARSLDRRITAVLEPAIRRALIDESLAELDPDARFALLAHVFARQDRASTFDALRDVLHALLLEPGGTLGTDAYAARRALYERAHAASHTTLMRVLRSGASASRSGGSERAGDGDPAHRAPRDLADIPLGRRRALARGDDPRLLEQLALDPDPVVIANLLQNPRTRTAFVVRLASMRAISPSTLETIHASPRWSVTPEVRLALARNPLTPLEIALKQLPGLPLAELREIARDGTLAQALRDHAEGELARRGARAR